MVRVFVVLGDSFSEGVGDDAAHLPHGIRGWADRVAGQMQAQDPSWVYANLAIRGKRVSHVEKEQLPLALAMKPELVSLYAGGNDLLGIRSDVPSILRRNERIVKTLKDAGSEVLLFTGYPAPISPLLKPLMFRNLAFNRGIREIARKYDAPLVDYWCFEKFQDLRMWSADRLHMSTRGHIYLAAKVLEVLGLDHDIDPAPLGLPPQYSLGYKIRFGAEWTQRHFGPWLGRRLRRVSSGDGLTARYPQPVSLISPAPDGDPRWARTLRENAGSQGTQEATVPQMATASQARTLPQITVTI